MQVQAGSLCEFGRISPGHGFVMPLQVLGGGIRSAKHFQFLGFDFSGQLVSLSLIKSISMGRGGKADLVEVLVALVVSW